MKKTFNVEVEYNELPENVEKNADVFNETSLEVGTENLMYGYKETNSIKGEYSVNASQIDGQVMEKVKEMTLRRLMVNLTNDCQEDADTGFSWELTIEEYIKNLFNI
jgi:gas vesicle protein